MRQTASPLESVELFEGIVSAELKAMLQCLGAQTKEMKRGAIILLAGDKPQYMGIVLDGQLHVVKEDYDGNRLLLAAIVPGELFAEALCCAGVSESPVTVMAERDSSVMLLAFTRILRTCPNACARHAKLIENMLKIIASKNLHLQNRLETISIKSVRAKVLRYLESFISKQGRHITIPFNRRELADFLCVERSALSHELARMRQDGLIDYKKNRFLFKA